MVADDIDLKTVTFFFFPNKKRTYFKKPRNSIQKSRAPTEPLLPKSPLKETADMSRRRTHCWDGWGRDGSSGCVWGEEGGFPLTFGGSLAGFENQTDRD